MGSPQLKSAQRRGIEFTHKFVPSALEEEIDLDAPGHPRLDNPATLYGRWWHQLFERLEWSGGVASAQKLFDQRLPTSPDPKVATKDWNAMRANLFSHAGITRFLSREETRFHRELPFSWKINDRTVLEGVIDSLMIDRGAGRCLLIDWKTNRIKRGDEEILRKRYRSQIAAYWKAVSEITKLDVDAAIFATATGEFIPYAATAEAEWERLGANAAEQC